MELKDIRVNSIVISVEATLLLSNLERLKNKIENIATKTMLKSSFLHPRFKSVNSSYNIDDCIVKLKL